MRVVTLGVGLWMVGILGCQGGPTQPADMGLFSRPASTIGLELREVSAWNEQTVSVGPADASVPVLFRWRSGFDDRNCERVEEVQVRRTGGPETTVVEVTPPRGANAGCNLIDGQAGSRAGQFERMQLGVQWSHGDTAGGGSVTVQGNGQLVAQLQ